MTLEEKHAYEVLAKRFGCSAIYIEELLEEHFEAPSKAGWQHMSSEPMSLQEQDTPGSTTWTRDELRDALYRIDKLRSAGHIAPLRRYITMNASRKDKQGKGYIASDEQLQAELEMQRNASIDPDGNLVQNGQIVKYGWVQSFAKGER